MLLRRSKVSLNADDGSGSNKNPWFRLEGTNREKKQKFNGRRGILRIELISEKYFHDFLFLPRFADHNGKNSHTIDVIMERKKKIEKECVCEELWDELN